MCRMIAVLWTSPRGASLTARLVELLAEAASNDPLLERIAGDPRHCHGYGYFTVLDPGGQTILRWERSDAADYLGVGEESCRMNLEALRSAASNLASLIERTRKGILILHARRASRGEPRGTLHAHPYIHGVAARAGYKIYALAHNGGVDKQRLSMLVGVDPTSYTDTHVFMTWLVRRLSYGVKLEEALEEAKQYVRTALDIVLAEAAPKPNGLEVRLHLYGYIVKDLDEERREYYRPLFFDAGDAKGYISSTVKMLADQKGIGLSKIEDIEGRLTSLEASFEPASPE